MAYVHDPKTTYKATRHAKPVFTADLPKPVTPTNTWAYVAMFAMCMCLGAALYWLVIAL